MRINEIYEFIQGELPNMGVPMTMCRLQGCPAPFCRWCDTGYALDPNGGEERDITFLINRLSFSNFICFSGGEPLMQEKELNELTKSLHSKGKIIEIETSGYYPPPRWWRRIDYWVVDYKCPSSGRESVSIDKWKGKLDKQDAVKFVVSDSRDLFFASTYRVPKCKNIISPVVSKEGIFESIFKDEKSILISSAEIDWIRKVERFCIKNDFLFSLQQQKLVWGSLKKGV